MARSPDLGRTRVEAVLELEGRLKGASPRDRVDLLNELAAKITASDASQARAYAAEALELARDLEHELGEAKALQALAYANWSSGAFDDALAQVDQALLKFQKLGDEVATARTYLIRSMVYQHQSRISDAMEAILIALQLSEGAGDQQGAAIALDGLGGLYAGQGDFDRALEYRLRCAEIHREIDDRYRYAIAMNNIGETYAKLDDLDQALHYLNRALEDLGEIEPGGYPIAATYHGLGEIHQRRGERKQAQSCYEQALDLRQMAGDERGVVLACTALGELRRKMGDPKAAVKLLGRAITVARELGLPLEERDASLILARIHEERKGYEDALRLQKRATELKDRVCDEEQTRHVAALQAKHEAEQKERDAEIHELRYVKLKQEVARSERAEKALIQSQKVESLGLMAGGIAHSFNDMLTAVLGNTELATGLLSEQSDAQDCLRKAYEAGQRAADLAKQMLAYAGGGQHDRSPCDFNAIVDASRELLRGFAPSRVELSFSLAPDIPLVDADETQVRQILMNLVLNGVEAGATAVTIRTDSYSLGAQEARFSEQTGEPLVAGPYLRLVVADNGSGMQPDTLAKLFDPFYSTKFQGRGLGLAAVLGIVRCHHAGVAVTSEAHKGSTFEFVFPLASVPESNVGTTP